MKVSLAAVLVITLILATTVIEIADAYYSVTPGSPPPPPPPSKHLQLKPGMPKYCPSKCVSRCKRNPRELCKKLCMHCCHKCKCVPDGPFGDKNKCPCYRDIKNRKGQSKCP